MTAAKPKPLLRVRQTASEIGQVDYQRRVVRGLGLRGIGSEVTVANTPSFRGMVKKVLHLLHVEEVEK
jgi:large subunit ribosomal protein L30